MQQLSSSMLKMHSYSKFRTLSQSMKVAGWKQATTNEAQLDIPVLFFFSSTSITVLLILLQYQ